MKYAYLGAGRKVHRVKPQPIDTSRLEAMPTLLMRSRCGYLHQRSGWQATEGPETCVACQGIPGGGRSQQEFDTWPDEPEC